MDRVERGEILLTVGEPASTVPGIAVVHLRGEHDIATADAVRQRLVDGLAIGPTVVDLSACSFLDSSIIACLIHTSREQGFLAVVLPPRATAAGRALSISGMQRVFACFGSLDEAVEASQGFADDHAAASEHAPGERG